MLSHRCITRTALLLTVFCAVWQPAWSAPCGAGDLASSLGNNVQCSGAFVTAGASSNSFGPFSFTHAGAFQSQGDVRIDSNEASHVGNPRSIVSAIGSISATGSSSVSTANGGFFSDVSADLRSGTLRSSNVSTDIAGNAQSFAVLHDFLHIFIPKSIADPVLTFRLHVDGTISGGPRSPGPGFAQAQLLITGSGGHVFPGSPPFAVQDIGVYDVSLETTILELFGAIDQGDSWLLDVALSAMLQTISNPGYSFDFANTARLELDFSPGITFTSESGALLTDPVQPNSIPEPSSVLMLATGLGLLILIRLSQRSRGNRRPLTSTPKNEGHCSGLIDGKNVPAAGDPALCLLRGYAVVGSGLV